MRRENEFPSAPTKNCLVIRNQRVNCLVWQAEIFTTTYQQIIRRKLVNCTSTTFECQVAMSAGTSKRRHRSIWLWKFSFRSWCCLSLVIRWVGKKTQKTRSSILAAGRLSLEIMANWVEKWKEERERERGRDKRGGGDIKSHYLSCVCVYHLASR